MAIRPANGDDGGTSPAAESIRQRARAAVARADERAGRAERGIGEATKVEISTEARQRVRTDSGPSAAKPVQPVEPAPGSQPQQPAANVEARRQIETRRHRLVKAAARGAEKAVRSRNLAIGDRVAEARTERQVERARRKAEATGS